MVAVARANYPRPEANGYSVAFEASVCEEDGTAVDPLIVEAGSDEGIHMAGFDLERLRRYRERETRGQRIPPAPPVRGPHRPGGPSSVHPPRGQTIAGRRHHLLPRWCSPGRAVGVSGRIAVVWDHVAASAPTSDRASKESEYWHPSDRPWRPERTSGFTSG